jgi:hypothetical protein
MRAAEWRGDLQSTHAFTPVMSLAIDYQFSRQTLDAGTGIETHDVAVTLARRLDARSEIRFKSVTTHFVFDPDLTVYSQAATLAWTRRVTDTAAVTFEGGPRYTLGQFRPDITATIVQRSQNRHMSFSYGSRQAVAVGVARVIDVQRVYSEIVYRPTMGTSAAVQGGVFVNTVGSDVAKVYHLSAALQRRLTSRFSFAVDYATDLERGTLQAVPSEDLPRGRNVFSVRLVAFPQGVR